MSVRVSAPARLHLGDIDPFGLGRFGFAPILAIDKPRTIVEATKSNRLKVFGKEAVEAQDAYIRTDTYETQEEAPEGATERTRLGVRYPELLAFIIGAM